MICSKYSRRAASLLVFLPMVLMGQRAQDNVVPLKNWATPLYWQPNQAERETAGQATPQLQFSANAVSANALTFIAITPCRLVDTRGAAAGFNGSDPFAGPSIASKATLTIPVQSPTEATTDTTPAPCGVIPSIAQAYSFNLTVVPVAGGAVDYVTMWPAGSTQPVVATLDDPQGAIVSNAAIVPAGPTAGPGYGGVSVYNDGPATTNVIIDMNGYFAAPTDVIGNTAIGSNTLTSNTTGNYNTAIGESALSANTTGGGNMASGVNALQSNTTGGDNTASGVNSLQSNTTGNSNTASGAQALQDNTTGSQNTASGTDALAANTTGQSNTASGYGALHANTTADYNTANGSAALQSNTTGTQNTASGYSALYANTTGNNNVASGDYAMLLNTTGSDNTATGESALVSNTTGSDNAASGWHALYNNTTGGNNVAIGYSAALNVTGGNSNNIDIGSQGVSTDGAAANSGVIRIGTVGTQTSTYIAGIWGNTPNVTNLLVCVDANGTLGTAGCTSTPSSRRFKDQIADMGDASSNLLQLRPVTFFYKPEYDDGSHALQYGLIAEEVAKIYPDMVGYDKDGQPNSVKYQALAPMLLNELQKQSQGMEEQRETIRLQNGRIDQQEARLAALEALLASKQ